MMVSARCAFLARGSRKAITPLETASTPVMAAQPPENAFINIHRPRNRTVCGNGGGMGSTGWGWPPAAIVLYTPTAISVSKVPMKRNVGTTKAVPVSFTPRRFTMARMARISRQRARVCGWNRGRAEVIAVTPAEMPTAAVRM